MPNVIDTPLGSVGAPLGGSSAVARVHSASCMCHLSGIHTSWKFFRIDNMQVLPPRSVINHAVTGLWPIFIVRAYGDLLWFSGETGCKATDVVLDECSGGFQGRLRGQCQVSKPYIRNRNHLSRVLPSSVENRIAQSSFYTSPGHGQRISSTFLALCNRGFVR